jgi:hypothetical protein
LLDERDLLKAKQEQAVAIDKVVENLQKQLAIERFGKDEAERREQLAMATEDADITRIKALQEQVKLQKEQNDIATELAKKESELADAQSDRAEEQRQAAEDKANALASASVGVSATQSRLLTRGPADRGIDKVAKNTEKTVEKIDTLTEAVRELRGQVNAPRLEVVG